SWSVEGERGGAAPSDLLPARIARAIASFPHAPAIAFEDEVVDYACLGQRAGRLSRELRARGAGPERRVAVLLEASTDAIVAMLAVLEAGAVWLPLDPSQPPERLRYMIEDCGASILVTRSHLDGVPDVPEGVSTPLLEGDAAAIAQAPALPPWPPAR